MKMRKPVAALTAVCMIGAGLTAIPASADVDYTIYREALTEFVNTYGMPSLTETDNQGNNLGAFCRFIDFNQDGVNELYLANSDNNNQDVQIYAIVDGAAKLVYQQDDRNMISVDDYEYIVRDTTDGHYIVFEYFCEGLSNTYHKYAFDGSDFFIENKYAVPFTDTVNIDPSFTIVEDDNYDTIFENLETKLVEETEYLKNYGLARMGESITDSGTISMNVYNTIMNDPVITDTTTSSTTTTTTTTTTPAPIASQGTTAATTPAKGAATGDSGSALAVAGLFTAAGAAVLASKRRKEN